MSSFLASCIISVLLSRLLYVLSLSKQRPEEGKKPNESELNSVEMAPNPPPVIRSQCGGRENMDKLLKSRMEIRSRLQNRTNYPEKQNHKSYPEEDLRVLAVAFLNCPTKRKSIRNF